MVGLYHSDLMGPIRIIAVGEADYQLIFDRAEGLGARLEHWHHDVYRLHWNQPSAWFDFGTMKVLTDHAMRVTGLSFDVPNEDIFFDEMTIKRVYDQHDRH